MFEWFRSFLERRRLRRKFAHARYLLERLEHVGIEIFQRSCEPTNQERDNLRNQLIALGSEVRFTILKYSRHEGLHYRDDVFAIMNSMVPDMIDFFIEGLAHSDSETRWSSTKWLRDKGRGQTKAIPALVALMRRFPYDGSADVALQTMGVAGNKALIELALDETASLESRIEAAYTFTTELMDTHEEKQLRALVDDNQVDERLRLTVSSALDDGNQPWPT